MVGQAELSNALKLALKISESALGLLKSTTNPNPVIADLAIIHEDFISLLSLTDTYATRLSISLKPPATPSAALPTLVTLSQHINSLASCALTFQENRHGKAIVKEARWAAEEVIEALSTLIRGFIDEPESILYLRRTGSVHHACDKAKLLSLTNREAVAKRVRNNAEALQDAVAEIQELIEDTGERGDQEEEDGWNELEYTLVRQNMSSSELETGQKALSLLQNTHEILRRCILLLAPGENMLASFYHTPNLDKILLLSDTLLAGADDLTASLDPPQDSQAMKGALMKMHGVVTGIQGIVNGPRSDPDSFSVDATHISGIDLDIFSELLSRTLTAIELLVK